VGLVVQKYGGTSVGSIERIKAVADRVVRSREAGNRIVVVVSAMAGETNRLFKLASELSDTPSPRETDVLVATGEQVSAALLAIRLQAMGRPTVSFLAFQMNLTTDSNYGRARIKSVQADRVMRALDDGQIVVVAGFQGVNPAGDIDAWPRRVRSDRSGAGSGSQSRHLRNLHRRGRRLYRRSQHLSQSQEARPHLV